MEKKWIIGGALAGMVATGGIVGAVSAQTAALQTGLSEEQIIAIALEEIPGEVMDVDLESEDGLWIYEVEVLGADEVAHELEIAAETGDILKVGADGRGCDASDA